MLLRLQQVTIEDSFSRHNIRNQVLKDVDEGLDEKFDNAVQLVKEYGQKEYWPSKNKRLDVAFRSSISIEEIVIEILLIILPVNGLVSIQSVAGKLGKLFAYDNVFDGIKTASEIIAVVCFSDIYDIIPARESETGSLMIKSNYSLERETLQKLANKKYLPPMLCPPELVESNRDNGYLTKDSQESIILGKRNHHEEYQALDVINVISQVALSLDEDVMLEEELPKKSMDFPEEGETFEKFLTRKQSHLRLAQSSREVYEQLVEQGNKFYFTWKFDKRGRMYSMGYHVNIQAASYKKALINLHQKHLITGV